MSDNDFVPDNFVPLTVEQITAALAPGGDGKTPAADLAAMLAVKPPVVAPKSPAEARARLDGLTKDREWSARFLKGDPKAREDFKALTAKASEENDPTNPVDAPFQTTANGELPPRAVAQWVSGMRELGVPDGAITEVLEGKTFTPLQVATAEHWKARQMRDPSFCAAYLAGDVQAMREMLVANAIISSAVGR
jgi:hypothetical protein